MVVVNILNVFNTVKASLLVLETNRLCSVSGKIIVGVKISALIYIKIKEISCANKLMRVKKVNNGFWLCMQREHLCPL